jgi:hypothetical protein
MFKKILFNKQNKKPIQTRKAIKYIDGSFLVQNETTTIKD